MRYIFYSILFLLPGVVCAQWQWHVGTGFMHTEAPFSAGMHNLADREASFFSKSQARQDVPLSLGVAYEWKHTALRLSSVVSYLGQKGNETRLHGHLPTPDINFELRHKEESLIGLHLDAIAHTHMGAWQGYVFAGPAFQRTSYTLTYLSAAGHHLLTERSRMQKKNMLWGLSGGVGIRRRMANNFLFGIELRHTHFAKKRRHYDDIEPDIAPDSRLDTTRSMRRTEALITFTIPFGSK